MSLRFLAIPAAVTALLQFALPPAHAAGGSTGLPLPRFVSLKSANVNMRVGPGRDYHIDWRYLKRGLPMEVIQEYDTWRKVRDAEGNEGWILHSLLAGDRTAIVTPWETGGALAAMHAEPQERAAVVAKLESGVVGSIDYCKDGWCRFEAGGAKGFVAQNLLWGVYPDETIED